MPQIIESYVRQARLLQDRFEVFVNQALFAPEWNSYSRKTSPYVFTRATPRLPWKPSVVISYCFPSIGRSRAINPAIGIAHVRRNQMEPLGENLGRVAQTVSHGTTTGSRKVLSDFFPMRWLTRPVLTMELSRFYHVTTATGCRIACSYCQSHKHIEVVAKKPLPAMTIRRQRMS